jgi:predicted ATP-dependent endonuclease of OLD family
VIKNVKLNNFAIFKRNEMDFSPNINIIIGKNSTGKSILMKTLYSVIEVLNIYGEEKSKDIISYELSKKLKEIFLIEKVGKLTTRMKGSSKTEVYINFKDSFISFMFSTRSEKIELKDIYRKKLKNAVYIPTKEIISIMDRGFIGLYEKYKFMEGIYYDLAKNWMNQSNQGVMIKKLKIY